ncbi:MFS transporter [Nakamurella flavida]|uniref:MFS transporter n=1 Tax=Nakamurella flavida TaxID=363630 RepID=A0A938YD14_9ACTN|nr:MFS transporter [Nakamurella flavida]MBM9475415.1 MFS transporter [Nakamurella flavida]MBM9475497.1 MFS transporter [Nakamurella flavida]MDP9776995.1 putative MFS family arabinose efflux permease [Nakamurella flavida]
MPALDETGARAPSPVRGTPETRDTTADATSRLPWAALLVMAFTGFLLITTETMPAGLLARIAAGLGTSEGTVGQFVSAYALGTILATVPAIALTRGLRRKPVFVVAVTGVLLANTVTAVSSDVVLSLGARFVAGAFSGLAWAMLAGYARRISPPTLAGRALSIASLGTPIGLAVGTPFGAWLGATHDWRWSFGILSVLVAVALALTFVLVPDAPGQQAETQLSMARVLGLPSVAAVLVVIVAWMVGHNLLYTYIGPYLRTAADGLAVEAALVTFGVAAIVGVAITGALVDRALRPLLLASIGLFGGAGVIMLVGHSSTVAVLFAIVLWGIGYGGAATQLQTAISNAAGPNADIANSLLGVAFNLAILAGGVGGALLLAAGGLVLPAVMAALATVALVVAVRARRAFPVG